MRSAKANEKTSRRRPKEGRPATTEQPGGGSVLVVASGVVVVLAALVRVWAAGGDFWLDEIWSLHRVQELSSAVEILTGIHHDNNHIGNSFYMYLLGGRENWILYRIPAMVAGTLAVVLSGVIARQWGRLEAFTAVVLTGWSYLLIHYSSEARGYGPAVLFALLSLYLMQRYLEGRRWVALLFCPVVMLGFLSHLTFVHVYAAVAIWSAVRFIKAHRRWGAVAVDALCCHAAPVAFLIALYYVDVRHMELGAGPILSVSNLITRTAAFALGAPESGPMAVLAGGAALLVVAVALAKLAAQRCDLWLFFAVVVLASPGVLLLAKPSQYLFVRYFLVCVVFFLLLLSYLLGRLYRWGLGGRAAYLAVLLVVVSGGVVHTADLLRNGRGHYLDAVEYMVANTPGRVMTVASDHDFRNKMVLSYYLPRFARTKRIGYYNAGTWSKEHPPHWVIHHSLTPATDPPATISDRFGNGYHLVESYPAGKLVGLHWFLYARDG